MGPFLTGFANELVKLSWESAEPEIRNGKLYHVFRGSNKATMTIAKAYGAKLKHPGPASGVNKHYREGAVEITDPKEIREAKSILANQAKRTMKRTSGIFGGKPWLGKHKRRRYEQAKKDRSTLHKIGAFLLKLGAFPQQHQDPGSYDAASTIRGAMNKYQGMQAKTGLKSGMPIQSAPAEKKRAPTPLTTPNHMVDYASKS